MELMQKFAAVKIQKASRITDLDRNYCEQHQKAYESAISSFQELGFFWADMNQTQQELLGSSKSCLFHNYLASHNGPSISQALINSHIEALHFDFIMSLTRYFNATYHISVDSAEISDVLLPKKPNSHWCGDSLEVSQKYHEQMQSLIVHYQDVVEQIILRLDGRSFSEQAFFELSGKCHAAAWDRYNQTAEYTQKKETIQFSECFCRFRRWPYDGWEIYDRLKDILHGLAHFETDSYQVLPAGFPPLFGYAEIKEPVVNFPACEKVRQMRLFKSGRVDLKFHSAEFAGQFAGKYLGTVY